MQGFGSESLLFQGQTSARPQGNSYSDILSRLNGGATSGANTPAAASSPTQTLQAVSATSDSAEISPTAQSYADLQAIIEKLNSAPSGELLGEALGDLKAFVNDNTGAGSSGGVLGELEQLADTVLDEISSNPNAFSGGFAFAFNANFSQTTIDSGNFYSNETNFSFSFNFRSDDTILSGAGDFSESFNADANGYSYRSNENVSVGVVTFNTNIEQNPALAAFNDIASRLTGITPEALAGGTPAIQPASSGPATYEPASVLDGLFARLEAINDSISGSDGLLSRLAEAMEERLSDTEAQAA